MEGKVCTECKEWKSYSEFQWNVKFKDKFRNECKICYKEKYQKQTKERVIKSRQKISEKRKEEKRIFLIKNTEKILKIKQENIERNIERSIKNRKKWYLKNKEEISMLMKIKYQENKEELKKRMKKYYEKNKEKIKKQMKKYHQTEKGKNILKFNKLKRRAMKKNALINNLTKKDWDNCLIFFDYKCAYCEYKENLSQDHVIPLIKNGSHTLKNIIVACKSCNSSKRDRKFEEWYPKQPFYSAEREQKILDWIGIKRNGKDESYQLNLF